MKNVSVNLKILAFILFVVLNTSCSEGVEQKQKSEKPNVLLILTDDQGSIDVNCYGSNDLQTPNMDRIADRGVRFTNFYAGAPVCSPSRAALLTGKTNLRAGLKGNVPVPEYANKLEKYGMPTEQITMAEMLKTNGYYTALVGKWHLGHQKETLPNGQGFDHFFGHQRGCIDNFSHFFYWQGPNKHDLYRNDEEVNYPGSFFQDLMVDEIKGIVNTKREEPFFIYWAFNSPHYPYQGSQRWLEHYQDMPSPRKEYAAFLSTTDESIGKVINELERIGKLDNTIIIFQSDHGHSLEERAFHGGGSAGQLRGSKFSLFEGGIRVPAIISYPGVIPESEVRNQVVMEMDWFPTVAALTKTKIDVDQLDGRSLMQIILKKDQGDPHQVMHWQNGSYDENNCQWAIRQGDWKLIGNARDPKLELTSREKVDKLFLVNLKMDVTEKENLADKYPDKLKELKDMHTAWIAQVREEMGQM